MGLGYDGAVDVFDFGLAARQHVAQHGRLVLPMMCEGDVEQAVHARQIKFDAPGACDFGNFVCDKFGQGAACGEVAELADPVEKHMSAGLPMIGAGGSSPIARKASWNFGSQSRGNEQLSSWK